MSAGWCVFNRATGEHVTHIPLTPDELEMPGYVETIENTYKGSPWIPVRRIGESCARTPPLEPSSIGWTR